MRRRSFLFGTSTILISQVLVGCNANTQTQFTVQILKGSIPEKILKEFEKIPPKVRLKFSPVVELGELFKRLQEFQKAKTATKKSEGFKISLPFTESQPIKADLMTLGDFWLKSAIANNLIQPLSREKLENWDNLAPKWQELVKRDNQGLIDKQGQIWAAPYRWGNTVIIYRRDKLKKFDWELQDWSDLWREELKGRISLLNQSREVIGLTLKKLGKSYNTENLQQVPSLEQELQKLNKQVKFYDSTNYLEPLIMGDTWVAVGWSNDIVSILSRYPQFSVVVPNSGTALWTDLWVKPAGVEQDLSNKWINFCWQPKIAKQIALLTRANSPVKTDIKASDIPLQLQSFLLTNPQVFDKSEFLLPLSPSITEQYDALFNKMKSS